MNPPITVLSPTGRQVRRHVHATGVTRGGLPVWAIDEHPFVFAPVASDKSGWCLDAKHRDACHWKPCGCPCHGEAS